ncbi:MAG: HPF/RaiA family ribosome-associated protein [Thiobacillus sp.]|nr:HPF/RaiA family ribosome-associated protein [Thiobacillus sp.]
MRIDIQTHGFSLTQGLREYVEKRLAYDLSHAGDSIMRLTVRLSDINGPRGGDDKRCLIEVRLKQAPAVVIEDVEADLYVAIDRAAERAGRTLARRLARQREFAPDIPIAPEAESQPCPTN